LADFAATPVDRALPFVILILLAVVFTTKGTKGTKAFVSFVSFAVILLPLLFFRDEHTRLLAYGVVVAIAMTLAARDSLVYVIAGVLLLRWIPLGDVIVWRELIVLAGAIAIYCTSRSALLAIAVALFTPIFPGKAMLIPFLVALILAFLPRIRIPAVAACVLFVLWPWSGLMSRALVPFLRAEPQPESSKPVWIALQRGESVSIDTPANAREVTITASGANAERLRNGTLMGTIAGKPVTIGDIADFGYTRREQFFRSRNSPPRRPIDDIKGYGWSAWLHTAGLITVHIPRGTTSVRIAAAPNLPPNTRLQIEAVDIR
ncbi:MAG TPA: hypothetical protein VJ853_14255, partial [Thermoanaerobaculia bacterium]|nr:hypothetical protein [Thermoanaerobaculia bacterium]